MLISYFGKTKEGKFEFENIEYKGLCFPIDRDKLQYFNKQLAALKEENNWEICMFNPIPEHLQTQDSNDQGVWK